MKTEFQSFSTFVQKTLAQLKGSDPAHGGALSIDFNPSKSNNVTDLFVLGRLIAFIDQLQRVRKLDVQLTFSTPLLQENLRALGFFSYCQKKGIGVKAKSADQRKLFDYDDLLMVPEPNPITNRNYWSCLVPITCFEVGDRSTESSIVTAVGRYVDRIEATITSSLGKLGIDHRMVSDEVARLLLIVVRELVSNAVTHSRSDEFIVAMTISRENETALRGPNRRGLQLEPGQDKYEFLVMDLGCGIYPSVEATLNEDGPSRIAPDYCTLSPWRDQLIADKAKEESLVSNIFRGDLVIRKGRRSEGLNELGKVLSWFGGILSFQTGRTGAHISAMSSDELSVVPDPRPSPYYLPGVTTSLLLPAPQLKSAILRSFDTRARMNPEVDLRCYLRKFPAIPAGLFGGPSGKRARRRSEIDAQYIIAEYEKLIREADSGSIFWVIDLKLSHSINVDFFDGLLQELSKRIDQVETRSSKNFFNLIFLNVPRNVVNSLKKRNCRSFLALKNTFCLLFDEADEPQFLGVPRTSRNLFDVEDALKLIYFKGAATENELTSLLLMSESALSRLKQLLTENPNSLFFVGVEHGSTLYRCRDLLREIRRSRLAGQEGLSRSIIPGGPSTIHRLRNGEYVDRVVNFGDYWSRSDSMIDVAKLLISDTGCPVADTILCFMDNGDRIASVLQRITEIANLLILDPREIGRWRDLSSLGRCVLVVDALYPGDDELGYVKECVEAIGPDSSIERIYAFYDFMPPDERPGSDPMESQVGESNKFLGIPIYSVPIPEGFPVPRRVLPSLDVSIVLDRHDTSTSRPDPAADQTFAGATVLTSENLLPPWRAYQFSPIEMSTEFWQNVSELGIIDTGQQGREKRNVLFYEHNEKFIQTPRMMNYATEFISEFVRNVLNSNVDVIVHPAHTIGSYLAEKVTEQLSSRPLILPLAQNEYGGAISITAKDYDEFRARIVEHERARGKAFSCLVLDDSVLSGNSIFTMIGIVSKLGLKVTGVLTLLNRLTPEISGAIAEISIPFGYLYRLHMPILSPPHRPDERLHTLNDEVIRDSTSYFAQLWGKKLAAEVSHFRALQDGVVLGAPPSVDDGCMDSIEGRFIDTHKLRHIIISLILHKDCRIIDFQTRVAIAYNFLDRLVLEDAFWELMGKLFEPNADPLPNSQNVRFIQKMMYILAFSRHVQKDPVRGLFSEKCKWFVSECFHADRWVQQKDLIAECLMAQGVVLSEHLLEIAFLILEKLLPVIMVDDQGGASAPGTEPEGTAHDDLAEKLASARCIVESLAWSLHLYLSKKGVLVFESESVCSRPGSLIAMHHGTEAELVLIDIFRPAIVVSAQLRKVFEIEEWGPEAKLLRLLRDPGEEKALNYLMEAPGYTCTLKSVLKVCKAQTILLYAMNDRREGFALRVFDTHAQRKPDRDMNIDDLNESALPPSIQKRMHDSLFFSSLDSGTASALDVFLTKSTHTWCMGGSVNISGSPVTYYVVLGYNDKAEDPRFRKSAYYYWLECEPLLREILPSIHAKYIESAAVWNVQVQALRPYHPSSWQSNQRSETVNARRKLFSSAMQLVDLGALVTQAVRMPFETATTAARIRSDFASDCRRLKTYLEQAREEHPELVRTAEWTEWASWAIAGDPPENSENALWCTLPMALFKLIAYECLRNALSNSKSRVETKISFEPFMDPKDRAEKVWVNLIVVNDIHPNSKKFVPKENFNGIAACKAAAGAVGGMFSSAPGTTDGAESWVAHARIPAFRIPDALRRQLSGFLK